MAKDEITDEEFRDLLVRGVTALETLANYLCGTPEDRKIVEDAIAVFGPDDPEDETTVYTSKLEEVPDPTILCKNCGEKVDPIIGGPRDQYMTCPECGYGWDVGVAYDPDYKPTGPPEHVEVP